MADPVQPQSTRLKALQNLSNQLPVANSQVAQGQAAARDMQLQQAVKAAPTTQNVTQAAQQTGAASAQNAGQQFIQNAGQQVKQQGQVGQLALGEQQLGNQQSLANQQQAAAKGQMDNVQRLASISEGAKQELYDKQMQFQQDELGRTLFNETQLQDYLKANAQSDEQFANYKQTADQLTKRKLQAMEQAAKLIEFDLNQKQALAEQKKDQKSAQEVAQIRKEIQEQMQRERARAANRAGAFGAGGTIVGAAAGAVIGGPAGAMVGGQAGGALGGMAASQTDL